MNEIVTVYSAEMMRRLRSRAFILGLAIGALAIGVMIQFPNFMQSIYTNHTNRIVLAGDPALLPRAKALLEKDFKVVATSSSAATPTANDLKAHRASAYFILAATPSGLKVTAYARDPGDVSASQLRRLLLPLSIESAARISAHRAESIVRIPVRIHPISSKFASAQQSNAARGIAYILLLLLYLLIIINSQIIMSSVAEEKTSRIAELLIASVSPAALLAGKIAASISLALIQLGVWVAVAAFAGGHGSVAASGSGLGTSSPALSLAGVSASELASFLVFFLLGSLQMSTLFASFGSLINRTEDLGSLSGPLIMPVLVAFFIALSALAVPRSMLVVVASFVPLLSPFVMFARIVVSTVPLWQVAVAIAINLIAIWGIAVLGGRVYRVGMLLYGRPPSLKQVWRAMRA